MGLETDERLQRALELAHAYLSRRDRTVTEVRAQLERRGVSAPSAEGAIEILVEQGYLNDVRFAQLFAADKREFEQWGSERIRRGLLSHGIDGDLIEQALDAAGDEAQPSSETELDRALVLLRRRFPVPPVDLRERRRALGVLLRKGYESELAYEVLAVYTRDT